MRALLVFVQQLPHLVDRERRVLPIERFLAFALIQKRPVLRICSAGDLFVGLGGIAGAGCRVRWISAPRTSACLPRRILERVVVAVERSGIELLRREATCSRKRFRIGFFLYVECVDARLFVYRGAVSDEFLLLLATLQSHIRPEQAVNQLALLILTAEAGKRSQQ